MPPVGVAAGAQRAEHHGQGGHRGEDGQEAVQQEDEGGDLQRGL